MNKQLTSKQEKFLTKLIAYTYKEKRSPTIRELQKLMVLRSPRSVGQYLDVLEKAGYIIRKQKGARNIQIMGTTSSSHLDGAKTIKVPAVGMVSCGTPILAEQNIENYISVSTKLARPPHKYFILKAIGNSMDKAGINDGDMVLVCQQVIAEDGQLVVALIDDEATIKRLRISKECITLEPDSSESEHQPIILERDFKIQGVIVKTL